MKTLLSLAAATVLIATMASAQVAIQQQLIVSQNDGHNGGVFDIAVQVQGTGLTGANTVSGATIDVTFQTDRLTYSSVAWNSGIDPTLYTRSVTLIRGGTAARVLIAATNVDGGSPPGFDLSGTYQTVATLSFSIADQGQSASDTILSGSNVVSLFTSENNNNHSSASIDYTGSSLSSTGITNQPLPIQLASFMPTSVSHKSVTLAWSTLSETNNYGFEVQRSASKTSGFTTLPGSFTKGNGTTAVKHTYSYTDASPSESQPYYRLRQIDLDNTQHFSDVIDISEAAASSLPTEYAMRQNYPNPFNPTTIVEFDLPRDSHVKLELYNILGQRVMTVLDETRQAGTQSVQIDGTRLSTGVYFYRLVAGDKTFMKKMTLIK